MKKVNRYKEINRIMKEYGEVLYRRQVDNFLKKWKG